MFLRRFGLKRRILALRNSLLGRPAASSSTNLATERTRAQPASHKLHLNKKRPFGQPQAKAENPDALKLEPGPTSSSKNLHLKTGALPGQPQAKPKTPALKARVWPATKSWSLKIRAWAGQQQAQTQIWALNKFEPSLASHKLNRINVGLKPILAWLAASRSEKSRRVKNSSPDRPARS